MIKIMYCIIILIALYSPVIAFLDIRGPLEKSLALFKNSFNWLTSEIDDRGSVRHEFEIMYPIKIKLSENGDSDHFEVITLSEDDCTLATQSMKLSEVILRKSSNSEFQMDSQLFTSSGDEVVHCTDLDVYYQHQKLIMEYSLGDNFTDGMVPRNTSKDHIHGHVFHVPLGRLFLWPSYDLGHRAIASNVPLPNGYKPIVLETLSKEPRVFKIYNFFTEDESEFLIKNALSITAEDYRLKRSSTGTNGYTIDTYRTSDNAFDTTSKVAMDLKRRCFELLGMMPYNEHWADGLQILRYNTTTAYINHLDYIESNSDDHDWDSAGDGTNRFATILLYMSDVEDGGETFFPEAKEWFVSNDSSPTFEAQGDGRSPETRLTSCASSLVQQGCDDPNIYGHIEHLKHDEATAKADTTNYLEEKNISHLFKPNSWQRRMVQHCRSKMSIRPVKAQAVLFYSQKRLGEKDSMSMHGGCPVLQGEKWAANLWVWNGPRQPYLKRERQYANWKNDRTRGEYFEKEETDEEQAMRMTKVEGLFRNIDLPPVEVYWNTHLITTLETGQRDSINTFWDHEFLIKLDGKILTKVVVERNKPRQLFDISRDSIERSKHMHDAEVIARRKKLYEQAAGDQEGADDDGADDDDDSNPEDL